jgi:transcriptional regulator with XRE-family HTH domain
VKPPRAHQPFASELAEILTKRGISQRELAEAAEVCQSHLSRLLRQADSRLHPSPDLMRRISVALDLRADHFVEYRQHVLIERIRSDLAFCDAAYTRLMRSAKPRELARRN